MITDKLKETLSHSGKFTTFSLAITMLEKVIKLLAEYGISPGAISFLAEGFDRIRKELEEGYKYIKEKEDFNKMFLEP